MTDDRHAHTRGVQSAAAAEPDEEDTHPLVRKPSWLSRQAFDELVNRYAGVPRCEVTGETEELSVDHIVPRYAGGTDDVSNLQFLTSRVNATKGIRPDSHWSQRFYWDQTPNTERMRGAQRLLFQGIVDRADWFGRPLSQIARHLYVNAWVVGAGKTLGIASAAWALNHVIQEQWGAARRADRILIVTKERAVRDQIAADLASDIPHYGIHSQSPRVAVVEQGWQFGEQGWLDEHDAVVTCVQQLWTKDGAPPTDLAKILAGFPVIAFDEPHFAAEQVSQIVDRASSSVCFGFTGTPIDAAGQLLERMVALTVYGYQQASYTDQGLKWLDNQAELIGAFVREIGITEAQLIERGERTVTQDAGKDGYDKNIEPAKSVVRAVIDEMKQRDQLAVAAETIAPHRDPATTQKAEAVYLSHGVVVCDSVSAANALCGNTNDMFDRDPVTYPPSDGWRAEVVHTDALDGNGKKMKAKPLTLDHPWLRAKSQGYRVDAKCSRLLFVVGIGREGVNNPPCGPIGIATSQNSVVEVVQRAVGRQLRAVVRTQDGRLIVPPAPLDTVLIITHEAFDNGGLISQAIDFVCEMEDQLGRLPQIDQIDHGETRPANEIERQIALPTKDKIDIAGRLGEVTEEGEPWPIDDVVTEFARLDTSRAVRIRDWATKVREDPDGARQEIHLDSGIEPNLIVTREEVKHAASDADLERHLKIHNPHLVTKYIPIDPHHRDIIETLYIEHVRRFHLPPLTSGDTIEGIRRQMARRVKDHLGRHFTGDTNQVHRLVGGAVKQKLGAHGEVKNDSDWDIPQVHALLRRPDVQAEIVGWVTGRLIDNGHCPALAALRSAVDEVRF